MKSHPLLPLSAVVFAILIMCLIFTPNTPAQADSNTWMGIHSIIVRPESLTEWFVGEGNGTFITNVDQLVDQAQAVGVRAIYIEMRAVDTANSSQIGHLYFAHDPDPAILTAVPYSAGNEDFSDGSLIRYLIDQIHQHGMQAYAWFPVFNDRLVYELDVAYRLQPDNYEPGFVSIFHPAVRVHEKALIHQTIQKFDFDGLNLDYIRYQADIQPQDTAASDQFEALYGVPISTPANGGPGHELWLPYLDFRAAGLTSFVAEVKADVSTQRDLEFGTFLMPHSAKTNADDGWPWGYYYQSWSGVDYLAMLPIGLNVMPMVYWENALDWNQPFGWEGFTNRVTKHTQQWAAAHPPSQSVPVYSAAYPQSELVTGYTYAQNNGLQDLSIFFYGDWRNPVDNRLTHLRDVLTAVNGQSPNTHPTLSITAPNYITMPISVTNTLPLTIQAQITSPDSSAITAAWYRFDGGLWTTTSAGNTLTISDLDLSGLTNGRHTLTLMARDASGRQGQDVAIIDVNDTTITLPMVTAVIDTNLIINWPPSASFATYQLHRSEAPNFNPDSSSMLASIYSPFNNPVFYLDTDSAIGETTFNHFYIIAGITPTGQQVLSNQFGEFDFTIQPGIVAQ